MRKADPATIRYRAVMTLSLVLLGVAIVGAFAAALIERQRVTNGQPRNKPTPLYIALFVAMLAVGIVATLLRLGLFNN